MLDNSSSQHRSNGPSVLIGMVLSSRVPGKRPPRFPKRISCRSREAWWRRQKLLLHLSCPHRCLATLRVKGSLQHSSNSELEVEAFMAWPQAGLYFFHTKRSL